ncbi:MAG: hypothetical protein QW620_04220 [Thermoplasmata archaeon]|nr:hypothetical protein [Thermoplasmata archaeon]
MWGNRFGLSRMFIWLGLICVFMGLALIFAGAGIPGCVIWGCLITILGTVMVVMSRKMARAGM